MDFPSKIQFSKTASNIVERFLLISRTNNLAKKYFLTPFWDSTKSSLFCKVRACRFSFKNSIFQKLPKMLYKFFFRWVEQIILPKNIFLPHFEIVPIFTILKGPRLSIFIQKFNFPKTASNVVERFLLMSGTNNFAKKYFLTPFWDSTKFTLFCKVRAFGFSVKNSIFQKLPKML